MRIFVAKNLMVLNQIDLIGLHSPERFLQLFGSLLLCATVDLCHQESSIAVSLAESLPHTNLTRPLVIVPTIVHEVDAVIDCASNYAHTQLLVYRLKAEVPAAKTNHRSLY